MRICMFQTFLGSGLWAGPSKCPGPTEWPGPLKWSRQWCDVFGSSSDFGFSFENFRPFVFLVVDDGAFWGETDLGSGIYGARARRGAGRGAAHRAGVASTRPGPFCAAQSKGAVHWGPPSLIYADGRHAPRGCQALRGASTIASAGKGVSPR